MTSWHSAPSDVPFWFLVTPGRLRYGPSHHLPLPVRMGRPLPPHRPAVLYSVLVAATWTGCSVPPVGWDDTGPGGSAVPPDATVVISGAVSDAGGAPVEGAFLATDPHGYEAVSGPEGAFAFHALPPGTYRVAVRAAGYGAASVDGISLPEDGDVAAIDVVLEVTNPVDGVLEVAVTGPDRGPVEGALVEVEGGASGFTDASGEVRLAGLGGEAVDIEISGPDAGWWSRRLEGVEVPTRGGVQVAVGLSGRPPEGSTWAGSALCGMCHVEEGDAHARTRHALALPPAVESPFLEAFEVGTQVSTQGALATLWMDGDAPQVTLTDAAGQTRTWPVDGLIADPSGGSVPFTTLGDQRFPLPVAWRAARDWPRSWSETDVAVVEYHAEGWFVSGTFGFGEGESPNPSLSADALCFPCHTTGFDLTLREDGGVDLSATSGDGSWIEAGVGCERCHGPGSAHIASTLADKPFTITRPDLLDPDRARDVCGQCHASVISEGTGLPYPFSTRLGFFEAGETLTDYATSDVVAWPSGAAAQPNQIADELPASVHGEESVAPSRCFDCHDPHGAATGSDGGPLPSQTRLEVADNALCLSCHLHLSFGDEVEAAAHTGHGVYQPDGPSMGGRCTGCHMPATSALLGWQETTGAGDVPSHLFLALPPSDTLDVFDAAGASILALGSFPVHACAECHAYNRAWMGSTFDGVTGDPTLRATHEAFQAAYEDLFP